MSGSPEKIGPPGEPLKIPEQPDHIPSVDAPNEASADLAVKEPEQSTPPVSTVRELDLTPGDRTPPPSLPKTETERAAEDTARRRIAYCLIGILAFIVVATFGLVIAGLMSAAVKEIITLLLGPVVALVGSATGYYFGSRAR